MRGAVVALGTALSLVLPTPAVLAQKPKPGQSPPRLQRVGLLMQTSPAVAAHIGAAFTQRLRELGHIEDQDVVFEYRWAEGKLDRLPALAVDLVRARVDLIIASSGDAAEAAHRAT